ncbi:MAG: hypothetical protein IK077_11000 [Thermoguttaceae bacterium]|nr:hypothetical protein [Thermoguttaceae bacterium]
MNLVGKIFVGIIALMSVVCLTLSVVSYAAHPNYKDKNVALNEQLNKAKDEAQKLTSQKAELAKKIEDEKQTYVNMIAALRTKTDALQAENDSLKADLDKLNEDLADRTDAVFANTKYVTDIHQQLENASDELKKAQELRANYLRDLAKTMEKLHELSAVYGDLQDQNTELVKSYDDALTVLNQNGLSADANQYGDLPQYPVQGAVETVEEGADGLLMVSIGSDDGLSEHNKLDVKRGDSYLGKIEVITLEPNRAVCKVLPEYRQGVIQEGDVVYSTRLN